MRKIVKLVGILAAATLILSIVSFAALSENTTPDTPITVGSSTGGSSSGDSSANTESGY
jgi:hypothetical protein